ncbi:hypothetical protein LCGC14_1086530, partial [marine sediment metagenome]
MVQFVFIYNLFITKIVKYVISNKKSPKD